MRLLEMRDSELQGMSSAETQSEGLSEEAKRQAELARELLEGFGRLLSAELALEIVKFLDSKRK